jgi:hypothetical protein
VTGGRPSDPRIETEHAPRRREEREGEDYPDLIFMTFVRFVVKAEVNGRVRRLTRCLGLRMEKRTVRIAKR